MIISVRSIDRADCKDWHQVEVPDTRFAELVVFDVMKRNLPDFCYGFQTVQVDSTFHADLIKKKSGTWRNDQIATDQTPAIKVTFAGWEWAFVNWVHTFDLMNNEPQQGFAFLNRRHGGGVFTYYEIPSNVQVDPSSGDITMWSVDDPDGIAYYPANQRPWPSPLDEPKRYAAFGMLNWLLKADDENPLTMISGIKSQPEKGAVKQFVRKLKKIQSMALKAGGIYI